MSGEPVATEATAAEIAARARALAATPHAESPTEDEVRRQLNAHGLDDAEIERQLATLSANTAGSTGVLTTYSLLHGLQHLDAIDERSEPLPFAGEAAVTLVRCAELCLGALGELARRTARDLAEERLDLAVANQRWRVGYHGVLCRISALLAEVAAAGTSDVHLDVRDGPAFSSYRDGTDALRAALATDWAEPEGAVFGLGLDDPLRFLAFNEYVNTSDERIWCSRLTGVAVAGASTLPGETGAERHERIVCSSELTAMLGALETRAETDLLPFRVVHQIAELVASLANRRLCALAAALVASGPLPREDVRALTACNRLLSIVDDVTTLMLRALTPRAYKEVRANLGMVRGTSSVVMRQTLFNRTYPLLMRAFRLRLVGLDEAAATDDHRVEAAARALLATADDGAAEADDLEDVLRQLVVLHQHIRTWRDNHLQLPKTHLGLSAQHGPPTVSLSGSDSAVDIAHALRGTHAADPVAPLFRAVLGVDPPAVHELVSDAFEQHIAQATAREVLEVYAVVQERYEERMRRKAGRG